MPEEGPALRVPFRLVDVFTDRPLAGNQLCVVPEPGAMDDALMQDLAAEIGFSETTFVTSTGGDRYTLRIFTPDEELPFAGHPTLGTAFVMVSEGRVASPATQVVKAGEIPVEVDLQSGFAWMRQLAPEFGPELSDLDAVAECAGFSVADLHPGLPVQVVSTGLPHLLVPARDLQAVARAALQPRSVEDLLGPVGTDAVYVFALGEAHAQARMLAPGTSIGEDPATGSAAGALGAYLAAHRLGEKPGLVIYQGEHVGRPSELHVVVEPEGGSWVVRVGGGVRVVARGQFDL
jgi:trans-2,3-dihydro-3-hydroxyanthranilate isomerase